MMMLDQIWTLLMTVPPTQFSISGRYAAPVVITCSALQQHTWNYFNQYQRNSVRCPHNLSGAAISCLAGGNSNEIPCHYQCSEPGPQYRSTCVGMFIFKRVCFSWLSMTEMCRGLLEMFSGNTRRYQDINIQIKEFTDLLSQYKVS